MNRIAWLGLVLVACRGESLSLEAYPAARLDMSCDYLVRCGVMSSVASCRAEYPEREVEPWLIAAVEAGTVRWDGDAAEDCLGRLSQVSCDRTSESYRAVTCEPLFIGTLGEGAACTLSAECVSNECWTEGCTEACCVGYCVGNTEPEIGEIGAPCRLSGCVAGARCEDSVCVRLLAQGEACKQDFECGYDLGCSAQRCQPLAFTGERCISATECRIVGEACGPEGTCKLLGKQGSPCHEHDQCEARLACDVNSRCAPGPQLGESCSIWRRCFDRDAVCDWATDTCILPKADGASCFVGQDCASDYCFAGTCSSCAN